MKINISKKDKMLRSVRARKSSIGYDQVQKTISNKSEITDFKKSYIYKNMINLDNIASEGILEETSI